MAKDSAARIEYTSNMEALILFLCYFSIYTYFEFIL